MGTETILVLVVLGSVFIIAAFIGELPKKFVIIEFDDTRKFTSAQRFVAALLGIAFYASVPILSAVLKQPSSTPTQIAVVNTPTRSFTATNAPDASNTPLSVPTVTEVPQPVVEPSITAPAENRLLLKEDFEGGLATGWTIGGDFKVVKLADNNHVWSVQNGSSTFVLSQNVNDYLVEAKIMRVSGHGGKLWLFIRHLIDPHCDRGYQFWMETDERVLRLTKAGNCTDIKVFGSLPLEVNNGEWHLMRLEGNGASVNAYFDGRLVLSGEDSEYQSKEILVGTCCSNSDDRFYVDDIRVWSLN